MPYGEVVQTLPDILIMSDEFLEMPVIGLGLDFPQQRIESFFHIADQTQIEAGAASQILSPAVHLNDGSLFRIKLGVGKIGAEQSAAYRIPSWHESRRNSRSTRSARRHKDYRTRHIPGRAEVVTMGDFSFSATCINSRMGAGTPSPAQNRHGLRFIQHAASVATSPSEGRSRGSTRLMLALGLR